MARFEHTLQITANLTNGADPSKKVIESPARGLVVHMQVQKVLSACAREYSRAQALARALVSTYRRRGPIIALKRQWWQHRDSRQFACLSYFLMRTGEFAEKREVVRNSLG